MKEYLVVLEKGETSWSAHAPDIPGCVAVGATLEETDALFREALQMHLDLMCKSGEPIPEPISRAEFLSVVA